MSNYEYHVPVLLHDCIQGLQLAPGGIYVDVTFGGGGHSREILKQMDPTARLIAFDKDIDAEANAARIFDPRFTFVKSDFRFIRNYLRFLKIEKVDGILADLGVSSHQFDEAERGFSLRFDGPLDMRMDVQNPKTAASILADYDDEELVQIFREYGELFNARQIVRAIRKQERIDTIAQLKDALKGLYRPREEHKFLARVFQALRIEVNDEMGALQDLLTQCTELLRPGGRLVVLSYHSLEDRPVKNLIKTGNFEGELKKDFYGNPQLLYKSITRKPIVPDEKEIELNNRARSARLRIAEKL